MYKTLHKKQGSVTVQLRFARSSVTFCAKRDKWHIAEFHKYGVGISADDFGSGYSSFNLMKTLDFDCIKIDQSFIRNILVQPADQIMVQSIINFAKALGVSVCVEGIESEEIFRFIREADPGMYQGYLFAQPLTITELEKFKKKKLLI